MVGPKLRGKAGAMANRVRVVRPAIRGRLWLGSDRRRSLSYSIAMDVNQYFLHNLMILEQ